MWLRLSFFVPLITLLLRNLLLLTLKKESYLYLTSSIPPTGFPANVAYQELNVPLSRVLPEHRCFLPNVWYSSSCQHDHLRLVALVSTAHIEEGDELFSTYYTLILWSSYFVAPLPLRKLTEATRLISRCFLWSDNSRFWENGFILHAVGIRVKK